MQYLTATVSRIGDRKINQDRVKLLIKGDTLFLVLGDGLGGRPGGEFASQTLINIASRLFDHSEVPIAEPMAFMQEVLETAHKAILDDGARQVPPINPGTTAVLCIAQQGHAWWVHVGDSRLYLFRNGRLLDRTQDHSVVENMLAGGQLDHDMSDSHPLRNVVTRCVGMSQNPPIITLSKKTGLMAGDILLLCTDGFWGPLNEERMGTRLFENRLKDALEDMAMQAEKINAPQSDNVSAIAVQIMSLTLRTNTINTGNKAPHPNTLKPTRR